MQLIDLASSLGGGVTVVTVVTVESARARGRESRRLQTKAVPVDDSSSWNANRVWTPGGQICDTEIAVTV